MKIGIDLGTANGWSTSRARAIVMQGALVVAVDDKQRDLSRLRAESPPK